VADICGAKGHTYAFRATGCREVIHSEPLHFENYNAGNAAITVSDRRYMRAAQLIAYLLIY